MKRKFETNTDSEGTNKKKRSTRKVTNKGCLVKGCEDKKSSKQVKAPIPKQCNLGNCKHFIENGLHFNKTDLQKGYGGICPECQIRPKAENTKSKIPIHSLMKTHLLYNCEKYPYSMEYKTP